MQHVQNIGINNLMPYYGLNNKIKGPSHKYQPIQFALMKIVNRITGHFLRRFWMQSSWMEVDQKRFVHVFTKHF